MKRMTKITFSVLLLVCMLFSLPVCVQAQGWSRQGDKWYYYYDDSEKYTDGIYEIGGKKYYFDESGVMRTGWVELKYSYDGESWSDWYYADGSGVLTQGWKKIGSNW